MSARTLALTALLCATPSLRAADTASDPRAEVANRILGLSASTVITLDVDGEPGQSFTITVPLDGTEQIIDLAPHSVRAAGFQVLAQDGGGAIMAVDPGAVRTLRGTVRGLPAAVVSGALHADGLRASIRLEGDRRVWIEPLSAWLGVGGAEGAPYVVYEDGAVIPGAETCGTPEPTLVDKHVAQFEVNETIVSTVGAGTPCAALLAADVDVEFFTLFGSIEAAQARVESIVNTLNIQYEIQTSITHALSTILVRTAEPDPYESISSFDLLCEFITEWSGNQLGIPRDVAVLFTGRDIAGGTIGRAADIGGTGICVNEGACSGGPFTTQGSYCIAQTEFNGNFSCATDLVAHELGHLWGAFHCSCPSNTMNPSIACANTFTAPTIASIIAYRDTRPCLDGECDGMGCCRPDGTCPPVDCNGNGIADECDLEAQTSSDCNNNGIPDECDLAAATSEDCNDNGIPDECDLVDYQPSSSGPLSPFGAGFPQVFTVVAPPVTTGVVIVSATVIGEFEGNLNSVIVSLNGQNIGQLFAFGDNPVNCEASVDALTVDAATFNGLVAGGDAVFTFNASPAVDPFFCDPPGSLDATVLVGLPSDLDGNVNGVLDVCECPADLTGPAGTADGNVDALDFLLLIAQWGSPCVGSCEADITGATPGTPDGNVDSLDFLLLISQWSSPAVCASP